MFVVCCLRGPVKLSLEKGRITLSRGQKFDLDLYCSRKWIESNKELNKFILSGFLRVIHDDKTDTPKLPVASAIKQSKTTGNNAVAVRDDKQTRRVQNTPDCDSPRTPRPRPRLHPRPAPRPHICAHTYIPIPNVTVQPKACVQQPVVNKARNIVKRRTKALHRHHSNTCVGDGSAKDLTVIIPYKDRKNIEYCIASIARAETIPKCIIVDFGSINPLQFSQYSDWLTIIRVDNLVDQFHEARALNIGINNVTTRFLMTTDADQIFKENFFGVVSSTLNKTPTAYVLCKTYGLQNFPAVVSPENIMLYFSYLEKTARDQRSVDRKNNGLYGDGCCNAMETRYAKAIGGYEEAYFPYGYEDGDMTFRAKNNKRKIIYINQYTSMIHLPHEYTYVSAEIKKNKALYRERRKNKVKYANVGKPWGVV